MIAQDNAEQHTPSQSLASGQVQHWLHLMCDLLRWLQACSFWSRKTAWRCFIAATLSTFTIQVFVGVSADLQNSQQYQRVLEL